MFCHTVSDPQPGHVGNAPRLGIGRRQDEQLYLGVLGFLLPTLRTVLEFDGIASLQPQ